MLSFIHFMILGKVQAHFCISFSNSTLKWTQPASENCFNVHGKIIEKPNNIKPSPKQKRKRTQKGQAKVLQTDHYEEPTTFFPL